jgi:hypothetical protein
MLKNIFLILSVCILLFGCKNSKTNNNAISVYENDEIISNNYKPEVEDFEYSYGYEGDNITILDKLIDYNNYYNCDNYNSIEKKFTIKYEEDIIFLKNFTQDDLSDFIVSLLIPYDSEIVAIPSITNLKNLKYFDFYSNIKNISSIANFENLEFLRIFVDDDIEGMDSIFELHNLKKLMIYGSHTYTNLIDLTHIGKLEKLEFLFIDGLSVNQDGLNNLGNLKQLKELHIFLVNIVDISPLSYLPNLEIVQINSTHNYYDITPLVASKSLKTLNLLFGSEEEENKFMNKEGKIFSEKGIYIPSRDWR